MVWPRALSMSLCVILVTTLRTSSKRQIILRLLEDIGIFRLTGNSMASVSLVAASEVPREDVSLAHAR